MSFKISDKIHTLSAFKDNKITILTTQGEAEVKAQKFLLKTTTDDGGAAVDLSECECVRYNGVKSDGKIVLVNLSPIDENYTDDGLCQLEVTEDMTSADGKVYGEIEVVYNGTASLKYYGINLLVEPSALSVAKSSASDLSALNDLTERMSNAEEKLERLSTGEAQTRVYFKKNCDGWGEPRIYVWKSSTTQNDYGTQEPYSLDGCNPWTWENSPYLKKSKDNENLYYYDIAPVYDRAIFFCSQDGDGVNLSDTGQFWYQTKTLYIPSLPYYPVPCYYQHPLGWEGAWGNLETSTFPIYIQAPNPKGVLSTVEPVTNKETGEVKYYEFSEVDDDPQYPQVDEFKVTVDGEEYEVKRIGYTPEGYIADGGLKVAYYKCDVPVDCEEFTLTHVNEDDSTYSISYDFWHSCYNYPVFYYKNIGSGTQYSESFAQFDGDYNNNFMLYISYNRNETKLYGDVWNKWGAETTALAAESKQRLDERGYTRVYFKKNCDSWSNVKIVIYRDTCDSPYFDKDNSVNAQMFYQEGSWYLGREMLPTDEENLYYYDVPNIYDKVYFTSDDVISSEYVIRGCLLYYHTAASIIPTNEYYTTPCYFQSPIGYDGIWGDLDTNTYPIYIQMPPMTYTGSNTYGAWWNYDDPRTMKVLADGVELELYKMGNIPDDYTGNTNNYYRCNIPVDCESFVLNYNEDNVTGNAKYEGRSNTYDGDGYQQGQAPCTIPTSTEFDFYHSCYNFPVFYLGYDVTWSAGRRHFTYYWTAFSGTTNDKFYFRMRYTMGEYRMYRELADTIPMVETGTTMGATYVNGSNVCLSYYKVGRLVSIYFPINGGYTLYGQNCLDNLNNNGYIPMPLPYPFVASYDVTGDYKIGTALFRFTHYLNADDVSDNEMSIYEFDIVPYCDFTSKGYDYHDLQETVTEFRLVPKSEDFDEVCQYLQESIDICSSYYSYEFSDIGVYFNNITYYTSTIT